MSNALILYAGRLPLAAATGALVFWAGMFRLIVMSTHLAFNVLKGDHPYTAVARLGNRSGPSQEARRQP